VSERTLGVYSEQTCAPEGYVSLFPFTTPDKSLIAEPLTEAVLELKTYTDVVR